MFINILFHASKNISGTRKFCVNVIYMLMPFEMLVNVNDLQNQKAIKYIMPQIFIFTPHRGEVVDKIAHVVFCDKIYGLQDLQIK